MSGRDDVRLRFQRFYDPEQVAGAATQTEAPSGEPPAQAPEGAGGEPPAEAPVDWQARAAEWEARYNNDLQQKALEEAERLLHEIVPPENRPMVPAAAQPYQPQRPAAPPTEGEEVDPMVAKLEAHDRYIREQQERAAQEAWDQTMRSMAEKYPLGNRAEVEATIEDMVLRRGWDPRRVDPDAIYKFSHEKNSTEREKVVGSRVSERLKALREGLTDEMDLSEAIKNAKDPLDKQILQLGFDLLQRESNRLKKGAPPVTPGQSVGVPGNGTPITGSNAAKEFAAALKSSLGWGAGR